MDIANLWTAWPIAGPWRLSPLRGGTNNTMWRADTIDGHAYALRLSTDLSRVPRMLYEAQLLQALEEQDPPFRLPVPLKATSGDILVSCEQEQGAKMIAILSPLLPGTLPDRDDLLSASHAASALAWLDRTLAILPDIQPPEGYIPLSPFGELALRHPSVSDPLAEADRLPVERDHIQQIRTFLIEVLESVPGLYTTLPQQLVHRDYDPSNILVDQHQVTAVLDFEFAGRDLRVLDLCVALSWWPVELLGTGKEWAVMDAFGSTYTQQLALSEEELRDLPAVFRLRDASSFMHRLGRYLAGMETEAGIRRRVKHSLWREEWLSAHHQTLLEHALAWL